MRTGIYRPRNLSLVQKLQTLIIGRLMAVFLILVVTWIWNSGHLKLSWDDFPQGLFIIFLISVGLTIVYFFVLRLSDRYQFQVHVQFALDSLLITWLIWRTGGLTSPYITLYIILIGVASLFLSGRKTLLVAVQCVALFTVLSLLTAFSMVSSFSPVPATPKIIQITAFHIVAFLIVGLLSSKLSERLTSGAQLRETTKTLRNLRVLHERIVESIRSGLITIDLDGTIFTFNATAEEITGYKAGDVVGKSIYMLLGDIGREVGEAIRADSEQEMLPRYEVGFTTPEGFVVQVGYGISPLTDEDGKKTGLIITFQDLTEIRTMEESVRRKDRLAAVGRVAAGLAHEIRNPLGAMRGAIQILETQEEKESSQSNLMEIILRESDRLNTIITNFLKYARPAVNNFAAVDVPEAILDTVTLLRHGPDIGEGHRIEAVLPGDPVMMNADVSQLKQIFWNLARNAIQSMGNEGTFTIELRELANHRIRIIFSDTGCGMTREQVEQLFEPFSKSTTGGTGLGLSIVYQIVRDHNGTITVSSKESEGTRITIELPTDYSPAPVAQETGTGETRLGGSKLEEYLNVESAEKEVHP